MAVDDGILGGLKEILFGSTARRQARRRGTERGESAARRDQSDHPRRAGQSARWTPPLIALCYDRGMDKYQQLKRSKRLALSLLLIAAATFVVTLFLPPTFWVLGLKAIAEAAMVGALADWFAVVALFRRVPVPFISRHTAIIPRNKDRIGENLGRFVQEKFLDTDSLLALIRRHDPSQLLAQWLNTPGNADRIGRHLLQVMRGFLDLTDDQRIQRFCAARCIAHWIRSI